MGWLNQHLYEFRIGTQRYGLPRLKAVGWLSCYLE